MRRVIGATFTLLRQFSYVPGLARARRSCMYAPGSNAKMLAKLETLSADTVILDLEDAVSFSAKAQARINVVTSLNSRKNKRQEVLVRINPVGSGLEEDDIKALALSPNLPDGIVLPKCDHPAHIQWLSARLDDISSSRASTDHICILALIESAASLVRLPQICQSSPRLQGLIFGADDYAANVGATRTKSNREVAFARNSVLVHAAMHNLHAIDLVNIDLKDHAGLKAECVEAFELGYSGKQIIHPSQLEVANACFAPDAARVEWAHRVVETSEKSYQAGTGAYVLDDKMIDEPTVKQARKLLSRAALCTGL
jgi:citrate lyase subunit beta-like protein